MKFYVTLVFFLVQIIRIARFCVSHQKCHFILQTIEFCDAQFIRILRPFHTRIIRISVFIGVHFYAFSSFQVVDKNAHRSVRLPNFRVLVFVLFRVRAIFKILQSVFWNGTFIKAKISNFFAVRRPFKTFYNRKFFFINPIGRTVYDFIYFTISSNLCYFFRS